MRGPVVLGRTGGIVRSHESCGRGETDADGDLNDGGEFEDDYDGVGDGESFM